MWMIIHYFYHTYDIIEEIKYIMKLSYWLSIPSFLFKNLCWWQQFWQIIIAILWIFLFLVFISLRISFWLFLFSFFHSFFNFFFYRCLLVCFITLNWSSFLLFADFVWTFCWSSCTTSHQTIMIILLLLQCIE